ncbi:hypothetical protein DdX_09890 [Ditylenchus destructor]|uniref:Uncharacterized protein n=1 Tax=Ditylenchus destructor TaxID=166010 RepID=A0AAD4N104_9BILA|nr:hypothetical protein DdX_09890 [Ditylenchus destructor]
MATSLFADPCFWRNRFLSTSQVDWYRFQARIVIPPEDMASGNPENPGLGQVTDPPSPLGFGRVIRQSLPLDEPSRLVPVSSPHRIPPEDMHIKCILTARGCPRRSRGCVLWNIILY